MAPIDEPQNGPPLPTANPLRKSLIVLGTQPASIAKWMESSKSHSGKLRCARQNRERRLGNGPLLRAATSNSQRLATDAAAWRNWPRSFAPRDTWPLLRFGGNNLQRTNVYLLRGAFWLSQCSTKQIFSKNKSTNVDALSRRLPTRMTGNFGCK